MFEKNKKDLHGIRVYLAKISADQITVITDESNKHINFRLRKPKRKFSKLAKEIDEDYVPKRRH
jgi:hypothetical protein